LHQRILNVQSEADAKKLERWFWDFTGKAFNSKIQEINAELERTTETQNAVQIIPKIQRAG